jgi:hypothetical protein
MPVTVTTPDGDDIYASASKWHIDEDRTLHVIKTTGGRVNGKPPEVNENTAAYACGCWESVRLSPKAACGPFTGDA